MTLDLSNKPLLIILSIIPKQISNANQVFNILFQLKLVFEHFEAFTSQLDSTIIYLQNEKISMIAILNI